MKFAPDGSRLAVTVSGELWVRNWPSGEPRHFGRARHMSWLPDCRRLVVSQDFSLAVIDTTDGSRRVIHRQGSNPLEPSVSPDGRKIAYASAATDWDVLTVSLPEGRVQTLGGGGEVDLFPDWAPSGSHFLFDRIHGQASSIEDRSIAAGFSRRVVEAPAGSPLVQGPRWSPDGTRFLFTQGIASGKNRLTLANASGGRWTELVDGIAVDGAYAWSPDGEWIAVHRRENGKSQLVKMKPVPGATPEVLGKAAPVALARYHTGIQWSPTGEWIMYPSADGTSLISPDGAMVRQLTARAFHVFTFSRDGSLVYGIFRNTTGEGAQWLLYSVHVKTGVEKMLSAVDLPPSTDSIASLSLHPDGKTFLTSIAKWPHDIWMLEGWDTPKKGWLDRLLRR
jgi:Tol biopolymer transport system component